MKTTNHKIIKNVAAGILLFAVVTFNNNTTAQNNLAGEGLSLNQAIEMAVNNHPLIKVAEDLVSLQKSKTNELQSSFYP